jgi:hypothetical protein
MADGEELKSSAILGGTATLFHLKTSLKIEWLMN